MTVLISSVLQIGAKLCDIVFLRLSYCRKSAKQLLYWGWSLIIMWEQNFKNIFHFLKKDKKETKKICNMHEM